jgi:hypothetical protein
MAARTAARMRHQEETADASCSYAPKWGHSEALAYVQRRKEDSIAVDAVQFCEKLNERWNPPYITVLPDSILLKILGGVTMKDAQSCLKTCKFMRSAMLNVLCWQSSDILSSRSSLSPSQPVHTMSCGIGALPNELLINIFGYLDSNDLRACGYTCQQWQHVTLSNATLWAKGVKLRGDQDQMDMQWKTIHEGLEECKPKALSMEHWREYTQPWPKWSGFDLSRTFPCDSIEEFHYKATHLSGLDQDLWNTLLQCTRLRVLHFSVDDIDCYCDFSIGNNSKLINCRLDDFLVSFNESVFKLNDGLIRVLSKARRIRLDVIYDDSELRQLLATAKDTLEDLCLDREPQAANSYYNGYAGYYDDDDEEEDALEQESEEEEEEAWDNDEWEQEQADPVNQTIVLTRLASFTGYIPRPLKIEAPRLTKLDLHIIRPKDLNVLKTWGTQSLIDFSCHVSDSVSGRRYLTQNLYSSLVYLPNCQSLSIDLGYMSRYNPDLDDIGGAREFWTAFLSDHMVLSNLKRLTIIDKDKTLSPDDLLSFVQARRRLGVPLEELVLVDFERFPVQAISRLQHLIPRLVYRTSQERCYAIYGTSIEGFKLRLPPRRGGVVVGQ